jgi:hypothetical protein
MAARAGRLDGAGYEEPCAHGRLRMVVVTGTGWLAGDVADALRLMQAQDEVAEIKRAHPERGEAAVAANCTSLLNTVYARRQHSRRLTGCEADRAQ